MSEFKLRQRDDGVMVLDGRQTATAFFDRGHGDVEEISETFKDGTKLEDAVNVMEHHVDTLIANNTDCGWNVEGGS